MVDVQAVRPKATNSAVVMLCFTIVLLDYKILVSKEITKKAATQISRTDDLFATCPEIRILTRRCSDTPEIEQI